MISQSVLSRFATFSVIVRVLKQLQDLHYYFRLKAKVHLSEEELLSSTLPY